MKTEDYVWLTKDNATIRMVDMEDKHIQAAHSHACEQEYKYFMRQNIFNSLREKLEEVAEMRKIPLLYPDERFPSSKWGNYFCAMRRLKSVVPTPVDHKEKKVEATLASNLKEIDPL